MEQSSAQWQKRSPKACGKGRQGYFFAFSLQFFQLCDDLVFQDPALYAELVISAKRKASVAAHLYDAVQDELTVFSAVKNDVVFSKLSSDRSQGNRILAVANKREHTVSEGAKRKAISAFDGCFYDRKQILKSHLLTRCHR